MVVESAKPKRTKNNVQKLIQHTNNNNNSTRIRTYVQLKVQLLVGVLVLLHAVPSCVLRHPIPNNQHQTPSLTATSKKMSVFYTITRSSVK
jgi:hypothetical protein